MIKKYVIISLFLFSFTLFADTSAYNNLNKVQQFILDNHENLEYSKKSLDTLFSSVKPNESVLKLMSRPAEKTKPWHEYQKIFADKKRLDGGVRFYKKHQTVLREAHEIFGVPPEIIVSIIGVETRYGKIMGKHSVFSALSTLAFDFPKRSPFFTEQLIAFLKMAKQEKFDPLSPKGSYAGAMGMAQFMPSSFLDFAVDYEENGKIDLWNNPDDAIFSVANYLYQHGWKSNQKIVMPAQVSSPLIIKNKHKPYTTLNHLRNKGVSIIDQKSNTKDKVGLLKLDGKDEKLHFVTFNNFYVITTYNTSPMYAMAVFNLSKQIKYEIQKKQ